MPSIKHSVPDDLKNVSLDELLSKRVARFGEIEPDWDAFADLQVEGRRRAQHRMIGAGGSGKHDPRAIPAGGFTLSIMRVPPSVRADRLTRTRSKKRSSCSTAS